MRRPALIALAVVAVGLIGYYGFNYLTYGRFIESTDDAYVKADTAAIAARVNGYVAKVQVADNQTVQAGDILVSIDDADFQARVAQARASTAAKQAALDGIAAKLTLEGRLIEAAQAQLDSAIADQKRANADLSRARELRTSGSGSKQALDRAQADASKADAAVASAIAALEAEREQLAVIETTRASSRPNSTPRRRPKSWPPSILNTRWCARPSRASSARKPCRTDNMSAPERN